MKNPRKVFSLFRRIMFSMTNIKLQFCKVPGRFPVEGINRAKLTIGEFFNCMSKRFNGISVKITEKRVSEKPPVCLCFEDFRIIDCKFDCRLDKFIGTAVITVERFIKEAVLSYGFPRLEVSLYCFSYFVVSDSESGAFRFGEASPEKRL